MNNPKNVESLTSAQLVDLAIELLNQENEKDGDYEKINFVRCLREKGLIVVEEDFKGELIREKEIKSSKWMGENKKTIGELEKELIKGLNGGNWGSIAVWLLTDERLDALRFPAKVEHVYNTRLDAYFRLVLKDAIRNAKDVEWLIVNYEMSFRAKRDGVLVDLDPTKLIGKAPGTQEAMVDRIAQITGKDVTEAVETTQTVIDALRLCIGKPELGIERLRETATAENRSIGEHEGKICRTKAKRILEILEPKLRTADFDENLFHYIKEIENNEILFYKPKNIKPKTKVDPLIDPTKPSDPITKEVKNYNDQYLNLNSRESSHSLSPLPLYVSREFGDSIEISPVALSATPENGTEDDWPTPSKSISAPKPPLNFDNLPKCLGNSAILTNFEHTVSASDFSAGKMLNLENFTEVSREFGDSVEISRVAFELPKFHEVAEVSRDSREIASKTKVAKVAPKTQHIVVPSGLEQVIRKSLTSSTVLDYDGKKFVAKNKKHFSYDEVTESMLLICSRILELSLNRKTTDYVPLSRDRLLAIVGDRYSFYINHLKKLGIVDDNGSYAAGNITKDKYCKGYRLTFAYDSTTLYSLKSKQLTKNLEKFNSWSTEPGDVTVSLCRNAVESLEINLPDALKWVAAKDYSDIQGDKVMDREARIRQTRANDTLKVTRVADMTYIQQSMFRSPILDSANKNVWYNGRLTSILTSLDKEIREQFLTIGGEKVVEVDIRCAQPSFLCSILEKWEPSLVDVAQGVDLELFRVQKNLETKEFRSLIESQETDFYRYLQGKYNDKNGTNLSRSEMKVKVYGILFAKKYELAKDVEDIFKQEFPITYFYIFEVLRKRNIPLWKLLQGRESKLVIDTLVPRLLSKYPEIKLFTVHDSIACPKSFVDKVTDELSDVMLESGVPFRASAQTCLRYLI